MFEEMMLTVPNCNGKQTHKTPNNSATLSQYKYRGKAHSGHNSEMLHHTKLNKFIGDCL